MVGVVPLPRRRSLVVVLEHPAKSLDVGLDDPVKRNQVSRPPTVACRGRDNLLAPEFDVAQLDAELLAVVPLLVTGLPKPKCREGQALEKRTHIRSIRT